MAYFPSVTLHSTLFVAIVASFILFQSHYRISSLEFLVNKLPLRLARGRLPSKLSTLSRRKPIRALVVLGSGGHTTEMLYTLPNIKSMLSFSYVIASNDKGSIWALKDFSSRARKQATNICLPKNSSRKTHNPLNSAMVYRVPRARSVRQSYFTSIFSFLHCLIVSVFILFHFQPDILLTNGPGTCVPIALATFFLRPWISCKIVYMESFACVRSLSLSGRLLYKFCDLFLVRWKSIAKIYPKSTYVPSEGAISGYLIDQNMLPIRGTGLSADPYVLITVGSTCFNELVKACDDPWFVKCMHEKYCINKIFMQIGTGSYIPQHPDIVHFRFQSTGFAVSLAKATLVIGHAGAGTILDTLQGATPMIIVPNESLMNDHQTQLSQELSERGILQTLRMPELKSKLPMLQIKKSETGFVAGAYGEYLSSHLALLSKP